MKQRYQFIRLTELCDVFGKSRQSYYERIRNKEYQQIQTKIILELIVQKRQIMPQLGGIKLLSLIQKDLEPHGISIGRDKFYELLRMMGLLIKTKRRGNKTTNSYHHFHRYPNLIKELIALRPNQVWVSDITYISIRNHFAYLSLITDLYSRKILGYCLYKTLETKGCINALIMALNTVEIQVQSLIHHSDKGIQYCSHEYTGILLKNNIQISMTEQKDAYENAVAERVNGILKGEFGLDQNFYTLSSASKSVDLAIKIYNEERPHLSCNMLTPSQAHRMQGKLKKLWKSYPKKKINRNQ